MTSAYVGRAVELVFGGALSSVVVALLALGPGALPAWGLGRRMGWGRAAIVPAALAFSSAVAALAAIPTFLMGGSLSVALVVYGVLALMFGWLGWRWGRGRPPLEPDRQGVVLGAAAAILALVQGPYMGQTADTFYHLAAARSLLATGRAMVTDPLYGTAATALDPTSGIWHTMLAWWSRLTTLDPAWLWAGLTTVAAGALVLALWSIVRRVSGSDRAATIAAVAWLTFALYLDLRMAAYPKLGSLAIVFATILAFLHLSERPSREALALAGAGGFAASSVHLGSAELLYAFVGVFVLLLAVEAIVVRVREHEWMVRPLGRVSAGAVLVGLSALPVVLPKLGSLAGSGAEGTGASAVGLPVTMGGSLLRWPGGLVSVQPGSLTGDGPLLFVLAAVLVVLMGAAAFGRSKRREALGGLALACLPLLLLANPLAATVLYRFSPYATERIAGLLWFAPYVAIAWGLAQAGVEARRRAARWLAIAALAAAALFSWRLTAGTWVVLGGGRSGARYPVPVTRLADIRYQWGFEVLTKVRSEIGERYPVVAGDSDAVYYLAGLEPVSVMAVAKSHSPFAAEQASGEERRADTVALMDPTADEDARRTILAKWRVDYVVLMLDRAPQKAAYDSMRAQSGVFTEVAASPTFALLKVSDVP